MDQDEQDPEVDSRWIEVGDTRIRVLGAGSGDDTVMFLHGIGARADRWRSTLTRCALAGYRALAVDFPGHGQSTKGAGQHYGAPGFAGVTAQLLDEMGIERVALVGTSLGAHVATLVALDRPRLVDGLGLVGPLGVVPVGSAATEAMAASVVETSRPGVEAKLRRLVHDDATLVSREWIDEEASVNTSPGASAALAAMAAYFRTRLDADVVDDALLRHRPELPCLLVWGACDDLVPTALAPEVLRRLPAGTAYVQIPAAAHAPYLERPDEFCAALLPWLQGFLRPALPRSGLG